MLLAQAHGALNEGRDAVNRGNKTYNDLLDTIKSLESKFVRSSAYFSEICRIARCINCIYRGKMYIAWAVISINMS